MWRPTTNRPAPARARHTWLLVVVIFAGCNALLDDYSKGAGGASDVGGHGGAGVGGVAAGGASGGSGGTGGLGGGCVPVCSDKACGPDGCGAICGLCDLGSACDLALGTCTPSCDITCGGECPDCADEIALTCTPAGLCACTSICTPDCESKACGHDGCGGLCGTCATDEVCGLGPLPVASWRCEPFSGIDPAMSFFVTSRGSGSSGGNLGGLAGADARCTQHAEEVGIFEKTWRAYLSIAGEAARDRIGAGPWYNAKGQLVVACTTDCIELLHTVGIAAELAVTERGTLLDWRNRHDILTGTLNDGTPSLTDCSSWTSTGPGAQATVGHVESGLNWASQHEQPCHPVDMRCRGGGHIYCFAQAPGP